MSLPMSEHDIIVAGEHYYFDTEDVQSITSAILQAYWDGEDDATYDDEPSYDRDEVLYEGYEEAHEEWLDAVEDLRFRIRHGSVLADMSAADVLDELVRGMEDRRWS